MANCVYAMARMLQFYKLPSLAVAGQHGKRHAIPADQPQAISEWLNPHSIGTISAYGSIANFAENTTCLINSQEITRSI